MQNKNSREREEILEKIGKIERMRQGTISEQYYGTGEKQQGPYYVLQGYVGGKHWSKRIPRDRVEQVKADLEAGVHFKDLCQQFADLTEEATVMMDKPASKKNSRRRNRSVTAKPKRS